MGLLGRGQRGFGVLLALSSCRSRGICYGMQGHGRLPCRTRVRGLLRRLARAYFSGLCRPLPWETYRA